MAEEHTTATRRRPAATLAPPSVPRQFDPTRVLGCEPAETQALFEGRRVTPGEAEGIAERVYPWRRHLRDPESYWVTIGQAAAILRTSSRHVERLLHRHDLPHIRHVSGVRLMRREQVESLAGSQGRTRSRSAAPRTTRR